MITEARAAAIIPEIWVNEAIGHLRASTVLARLVRRDYANEFAGKGDTIHIPKRGTLTVRDKVAGQPATADAPEEQTVDVVLDQHKYVRWKHEDATSTLAKDIGLAHIIDGVPTLVEAVETFVAEVAYAGAGDSLGAAATDMDEDDIILARKTLNDQRCPTMNRHFIVSSKDDAALTKLSRFTSANERGDDGQALREARLGRLHGFDFYMSQLVPETGAPGPITTHNLALHPNAVVLATRPLRIPEDANVVARTITDPVTGLTLRILSYYDGGDLAQVWHLDILFGAKVIDPRLIVEHKS